MVRRYWPGRDPVGERIWFDSFDPKPNWLTIVGVAGDVRQLGLGDAPQPEAYVSYRQIQIKAQLGTANVAVQAAGGDPRRLIPALRGIVRGVHPEAATSFRLMDDVVAGASASQRFQAEVLGLYAGFALFLAALGLYGVMTYMVDANRRAIGIRMALGARPARVFRMVAGRALQLTAAGAALGLLGSFALRGLLRKIVFGVGPSEPGVLLAAAAVLFAAGLVAAWLPARRAMRVDPTLVLREE
jgi:putative ABC transport system permease protein